MVRRTGVNFDRKMSVVARGLCRRDSRRGVKIEIDINVDIKSSLRAFALLFWMKIV